MSLYVPGKGYTVTTTPGQAQPAPGGNSKPAGGSYSAYSPGAAQPIQGSYDTSTPYGQPPKPAPPRRGHVLSPETQVNPTAPQSNNPVDLQMAERFGAWWSVAKGKNPNANFNTTLRLAERMQKNAARDQTFMGGEYDYWYY